jgi:hypothetical protein
MDKETSERWLGWHWLPANRKCQSFGGRDNGTEIKPGMTLGNPVDYYGNSGSVILCQRGYHASRSALDAFKYAFGPIICRVKLGGEIVEGHDKAAASQRTCLWMADATAVLREFTFQVAEKTIREYNFGDCIQSELLNTIEMIRKVANGQLNERVLDGIREKLYYIRGVPDFVITVIWETITMAEWVSSKNISDHRKISLSRSPYFEHNTMLTGMLWKLAPPGYEE